MPLICTVGHSNRPIETVVDLLLTHRIGHVLEPHIELTLLIGPHGQRHFLGSRRKASLTGTVRAWRDFAPDYLPLPHPSARNTPWFQRHAWFEGELLSVLRERVGRLRTSREQPLSKRQGMPVAT